MVAHTPPEELLFDYAAGTLPEPLALFVVSHLSLAPESRRRVRDFEAVGGTMIDNLEPASLSSDALDKVMARLDDATAVPATPAGAQAAAIAGQRAGAARTEAGEADGQLPAPLRRYLGTDDLAALNWKERSGQIAEYPLLPEHENSGYKTRLLRMAGGAAVPNHTHEGEEYTLVLEGGFSDSGSHYLPGDVSAADDHVTHRPVADPEGCTCLIVTTAPLRMTGPVGRFLNLFVDM